MIKKIGLLLVLSFFAGESYASCMVHYNRTACPGKEKISYKKCKGEKECEKKKPAKDLAACQKAA